LHLRNAPTSMMKKMDYGKGYHYAHDHAGSFFPEEFLPDAISSKKLYAPGNTVRENEIKKWLQQRWGKKYNY